jgi:hypothetical protein
VVRKVTMREEASGAPHQRRRRECFRTSCPAAPGHYGGGMRRLLVVMVTIVLMALVREILLDRSPRRDLHGASPVIGSLDTWPTVPRRPAD